MFYIILTLFCITTQVNSYVLLQVRKDDQNRSNVDALIHKVVPSDQFDILAKKIARKQFSGQQKVPTKTTERDTEESLEIKEEKSKEVNIKKAIKDFVDRKPEFRTKDFVIKPHLIQLRSNENQPSLMYEVNSNVLLKALKDFLSSELVAQYTDDMAKRAAVVYRSMRKNNF